MLKSLCLLIPKKEMCSKGFEPPTHGLEGRCSIQLSYEHICSHSPNWQMESGWWESNPRIQLGRLVFYHWTTPAYQSGWQDSNLRPPGPKPGALAKLSHTPICCFAVSFLLPHRSDSDIISPYFILVNTFLHFFEINFSNTIHPAFLQCFRWLEITVLLTL